jgi:hypothetical protein
MSIKFLDLHFDVKSYIEGLDIISNIMTIKDKNCGPQSLPSSKG